MFKLDTLIIQILMTNGRYANGGKPVRIEIYRDEDNDFLVAETYSMADNGMGGLSPFQSQILA